ncbi:MULTISPECIES: Crp/Fnr family transcriptional regulator [unclassified Sphingobacterium]|uniref:Crp/Fnr family transcriptional regulator n=1 Tax=unclassified Sphingobacterium TaxID=2609468 RepID=UPI00104FF3E5|nr:MULTISPECIES: Crp/Fnr family transcriptional regulator [unclassified Sphingobacterium]MCS3554342.1 CRP-like cAMP-binding protein [Sphingobacterium sp. JUb21]TCR08175.1 CRP-like cAMP-binding protein [Sphingobacterium sp. JUb20]
MDIFKDYIKKRIAVTEEQLEQITSSYTQTHVKKKSFILQAGEICNFEGFVKKGCFKIFYLTPNGEEHILYFAIEEWWISDIASFNDQEPAQLYIQALEDSEILIISREQKEKLFTNCTQVERLFRIMSQRAQVASQHRIIAALGFTAQERYLDFIKRYPKIYPRISNLQLASYIGVTQEFLSRLKRQILKPKK